MQQQEHESDEYSPVAALEGTNCTFCDEGELIRGVYKGNTAVICDSCETPGAQFW